MGMLDILGLFVGLLASFALQVGIVLASVSFVKELFNLKGNKVRGVAFLVGLFFGAVFLWPWIVLNPGLHLSFYVLISVLFLVTAGLVASGYYDLKQEI